MFSIPYFKKFEGRFDEVGIMKYQNVLSPKDGRCHKSFPDFSLNILKLVSSGLLQIQLCLQMPPSPSVTFRQSSPIPNAIVAIIIRR